VNQTKSQRPDDNAAKLGFQHRRQARLEQHTEEEFLNDAHL